MLRLPYHNRYAYSPIVERKDYSWPDGKRLAVYLGLNITSRVEDQLELVEHLFVAAQQAVPLVGPLFGV